MDKMEAKLDSLKKKPINDIVVEADLQSMMNMALVLNGKQADLLRLRTLIDELKEINCTYVTVSFSQFRIVKRREWEEFNKWIKTKR